jgi:long-chain acyl-CoA synthetase
MIITGGENVYSVEVERAIASFPGVEEVAVIGVPDDRWGERVHAIVVGEGLDPDAIVAHCRERIGGYKLPRSFELRAEPLPKSGAGKVLKGQLR